MDNVWKKVWSLDTIPRHKILLWRIINKALLVKSALISRGIMCSMLCPRCEAGIETIDHLFLSCDLSKRELFDSHLGINFQTNNIIDFAEWLTDFISCQDKATIIDLAAILYSIWHTRNQRSLKTKSYLVKWLSTMHATTNLASIKLKFKVWLNDLSTHAATVIPIIVPTLKLQTRGITLLLLVAFVCQIETLTK